MSDKWQYSTYSEIDDDVRQFFPFKKARKGQLEIISEIKYAISQGYKYIVLEAGTGTGKSVIAATLALMAENAYILTVTKQLQNQYYEDFKHYGFKLIKGRGNYPCLLASESGINESCDFGLCVTEGVKCNYNHSVFDFEKCLNEKCCEYIRQKSIAILSDVVITNYSYAKFEFNQNFDFQKRELMICDEAHNLESQMIDFLTLEFNKKDLKEEIGLELKDEEILLLKSGDVNVWIDFIKKIRSKYKQKQVEYLKISSKPNIKILLKKINHKLSDFNNFIEYMQEHPKNWIFDENTYVNSIYFKPIKISFFTKNMLFNHADVCLLMSATILDCDRFAADLGIDKNSIYAIRKESPFDILRNPVQLGPKIDLSYSQLDQNAPLTIPFIKFILDKHKNDKGIIHTVSYSCKKFLMENLNNPRLIDHDTWNRESVLNKFENSDEPLVLISPSMNEGVDLPGDKCRFQIIYKIPYPSLADKHTKARTNEDESWYKYKTAINLIQTHGRGLRSQDDYCITYFVDGRLEEFIRKDSFSDKFIPESFKESINKQQTDVTKKINEEFIELGDNRKINELIIDDVEDIPEFKTQNYNFDDNLNEVMIKASFIEKGDELIKKKDFDNAKKFFKSLIDNEYFVNDYYPYKKLVYIYQKIKEWDSQFKILNEFFEKGIYVNKADLIWFKIRLKRLSKRGYCTFNYDKLMEEKYKSRGLLNKELENIPVVSSDRIKIKRKVRVISESEHEKIIEKSFLLNTFRYEKRYGDINKAVEVYKKLWDLPDYKKNINTYKDYCNVNALAGNWKNVIEICDEYFKSNARKTSFSVNYFKNMREKANRFNSNKNSSAVDVDNVQKSKFFKSVSRMPFSGRNSDEIDDDLIEKFKLILKLKNFKSEGQVQEYVKCLESLKTNKYFLNDYYPYRQLVIHYKNDETAQKKVILEFFESGICCNYYNYIWFIHKLKRMSKPDFALIRKCENLFKNANKKPTYPLADQFKGNNFKDLSLISKKDYDISQKNYEIEEIGRDLEKDDNYIEAINLYKNYIKNTPNHSNNIYERICICYRNIGDYESELKTIEEFFKNPNSIITCYYLKKFEQRLNGLKKFYKHNVTVEDLIPKGIIDELNC